MEQEHYGTHEDEAEVSYEGVLIIYVTMPNGTTREVHLTGSDICLFSHIDWLFRNHFRMKEQGLS